jgi:hypothetical protein
MAARNEAARILAQFEELDHYDPERDEFPDNLVTDRSKSLATVGAQFVAFAHSNQVLLPVLHKLKFSPQAAGNALIHLSQMTPASVGNGDVRQQIMRQLRLGRRFGHVRD